MDLSIIIPAFNEEKRLGSTLDKVRSYLSKQPFSAEVIVVDDGSRDGTAALVRKLQGEWSALKLIENGINQGKGFSVTAGVLVSQGDRILFSDADLSTPIEEYERLGRALNGPLSIAIASRALDGADVQVHQAWYRETMGKTFNKIVKLLAGLPFEDTQCGFKLFTAPAARMIFPKLRTRHFAFDVEVLFIARRSSIPVREVPVRWANDPASRVDPLRDSSRMLLDVIRIRWNDLQGVYS